MHKLLIKTANYALDGKLTKTHLTRLREYDEKHPMWEVLATPEDLALFVQLMTIADRVYA